MAPQRASFATYASGLIGAGERKSAEPGGARLPGPEHGGRCAPAASFITVRLTVARVLAKWLPRYPPMSLKTSNGTAGAHASERQRRISVFQPVVLRPPDEPRPCRHFHQEITELTLSLFAPNSQPGLVTSFHGPIDVRYPPQLTS